MTLNHPPQKKKKNPLIYLEGDEQEGCKGCNFEKKPPSGRNVCGINVVHLKEKGQCL